jgi:hypothetical protein
MAVALLLRLAAVVKRSLAVPLVAMVAALPLLPLPHG